MQTTNQIQHYGKPAITILLAAIALFGFVYTFIPPDQFLQYKYWVALTFFNFSLIAYLFWLAFDFKSAGSSIPSVKRFLASDGILLATNRDWLGVGVATVIYRRDGDFERHLCNGEVINIQRNGLVQIRVADDDGVRNAIVQQDLATLIIRPGGWIYANH